MKLVLLALLVLFPTLSSCLNNGLGLTPAMGLSTWNHFQLQINETIIFELADAMVNSGLREFGYIYLNIDDGYLIPGRDQNGNLIPDSKKFPNGIKHVADYVHNKGLKLGLYTARTLQQCGSKAPGMIGYEQQDANQFAAWECDYLKVDSCTDAPLPPGSNASEWETLEKIRDALNKTGRPIYLSICPTQTVPRTTVTWYGFQYTVDFGGPGINVRNLANSWLVEYVNMYDCFNCTVNQGDWQGLLSNLLAHDVLTHWNYAQPGGWNDLDMMEICNGGMSTTEYQSHMSLWAILASPLILGNDVRSMSDSCLAIISNKEVIAVDQDKLGITGHLAYESDDQLTKIYTRPLSSNMYAAVLFNAGPSPAKQVLTWEMLDVHSNTKFNIRDLWKHQDLGVFQESFSASVPPHGVVMITLTPVTM